MSWAKRGCEAKCTANALYAGWAFLFEKFPALLLTWYSHMVQLRSFTEWAAASGNLYSNGPSWFLFSGEPNGALTFAVMDCPHGPCR